MPENLFFLAVLPPPSVRTSILELKEFVAARFHSKHALKSPPHITLIPPFWSDATVLTGIISAIPRWIGDMEPFPILLKDFNCFRPRVIYIDVKDPDRLLEKLQTRLKSQLLETYGLNPDKRDVFRPHCTIAFKDLSKKLFYQAWNYFRDKRFERSLLVDSVVLLHHKQGIWRIYKEIPFGVDQSGY